MKQRNKIILIIICSILVLCTVSTAGVLIWKNAAKKTPVSEEVLIDGGKATATDETALRNLLLKEEELIITLTEDITVDETLIVKGKKTLSGTGSVAMELYVMPYGSVLSVTENSTLILDGVTVNGNGIANSVKVEKKANLTLLSGEIAWGNPYGIEVQGNAEIKGGTITDAIHTGIFVGTQGNVQMNAGTVKSAGYTSTRISKGGYMALGGDAILQNCGVYHIHNAGTCDVTGGVVRDSKYSLAASDGELNIHYQGTDGGMIEWCNAAGSGIWVGEGGSLNASGFYVHDVGYAGVNSGQGTGAIKLENCKFENTGNNALHIKTAMADLKNIEIIKPGKHGVFVNSPTTVAAVENLTVTEPAERGLHNAGGNVTAKNVVVTSPGTYGVSTGSSSDTVGSLVIDNLTITNAGANLEKTQPAINCYKSSLKISNATLKDSNNAGARVTDGGTLTLKNVKIENTKSYGVYIVNDKSNATLEHVSISNTVKHGVYVNNAGAKATINKLTVTGAGERGIHNAGGTITAKDVTIKNPMLYGVSTGSYTDSKTQKTTAGSVTIDNLSVTGAKGDAAINSYKSVLTITNANISDSAKVGARVTDGGTLNLTDVEITKTGYEGVFVNSEGKATLKNITVTDAGKHGVYTYRANSQATIENLTVVNAKERGVHNAGGKITAKNVTIANTGLYGVSTGSYTEEKTQKTTDGSVIIDNLTVTGAKGDAAVNSYKSVLKITNAKIEDSAKVGVRVTDAGKLTLTNAEITTTGGGYEGVLITSEGQATLKDITVTGAGKHGVYVKDAASRADIDTLTVTEPKERGVHNAGGTIVAENVTITSPGTYGVSTAKTGESAGSVVVENLTVTGAGQNPDDKQPAVNAHDGSVVTVNGATISDCNNAGARATKGATIILNNVKITNVESYGVYVTDEGSKAVIDTLTITKTEEREYSSQRGIYNEGGTVEAKKVTIDSAKTYAVSTYKLGSINIEDLTVTNSIAAALHVNNSELTVEKGTVTDTTTHGVLANYGGNLNLTDVTFDDVGKNAVYIDGATGATTANLTKLTIKNAGLHGIYVNGNEAEAYAKDVTISTAEKYTLNSDTEYGDIRVSAGGYAEVEKANITDSKEYGVYVAGSGTLNLTGVSTITDAKTTGIYVAVNSTANINVEQNESTKAINKLTITGGTRGIYNVGGVVNAYHVAVSDTSSYGVQTEYSGETKGRMEIHNLSVDGAKGTASIYTKGSELIITDATLSNSTKHGTLINYGGILRLTDAIIEITGASQNGIHLDGDSGESKAYLTNLTIKDAGQYGVHAYGADGYIEIDGLQVVKSDDATYSCLRGIANKGATIVATDVEIDSAKDYSVSTYKSSDTAKGNLTINDLSVTNSLKTAVHVNESSMTINGAKLKDFVKFGAVVYTGGILNLNDAVIDGTGEYGIFLESVYANKISTLNMDGTNSIANVTKASVYVQPNTIANINTVSGTLSITNCENGIHNVGGTVTAQNIVINTPNVYGVLAEAYVDEDTKVVTKGTATITGLIIDGAKVQVNEDDATIADAAIIVNNSELTINGAETMPVTITNSAKSGVGVIGGGVLNLTNSSINNAGAYGICVMGSGSKANIFSLNIDTTAAGKDAIYAVDKGEINLNGISKIVKAGKHGVYAQNADAKININMREGSTPTTDYLTITNVTERGIHNAGGTIQAKNVKIDSSGQYGVSTGDGKDAEGKAVQGSVTIYNLTVEKTGITKVQPAVNSYKSVLSIIGATITDSYGNGARVTDNGTLNLTDVTITNTGLSTSSTTYEGILVNSGGTLNLNGINDIIGAESHGIKVMGKATSSANVNLSWNEDETVYSGLDESTNRLTITKCGGSGIYITVGSVRAYHVDIDTAKAYGVAAYSKSQGYLYDLVVKNTQGNAAVYANNSELHVVGAELLDSKNHGVWAYNEAKNGVEQGPGKIWLTDVTIDGVGRYGVWSRGTNSVVTFGENVKILNTKGAAVYLQDSGTTSGTYTTEE